ncbi:hypothetical protein C6A85_21855, partial [Mycobacterium sp. ITM-2017-0098]
TMFDPFGYANVRRIERQLLADYTGIVTRLAADLAPDTYDRAVGIAGLPDMVRGYEHIKLASVEAYRARLHDMGV